MLAEGTRLSSLQGEYLVERVLRASAQMITFAACEVLTGYQVVIKELRLHALENWKALELFEREIEILKQLEHSALPLYLDSFSVEEEGQIKLYLVMSWKEGISLQDKLESGWLPAADEVWDIARQVLEILNYLQSFNPPIIHRDIKPGNLILDQLGQVQLVDFGAVQGVLSPDGGSTIVGTFGYMPPEQFSDRCVPASDLYALGATLVHLLTGKYPSDLPRQGFKLDYRPSLAFSDRRLNGLDKLLEPDPNQRFLLAREALDAFDHHWDLKAETTDSGRIFSQRKGSRQTLVIKPEHWLAGTLLPLGSLSLWLFWFWTLLFSCYGLSADKGANNVLLGLSCALLGVWAYGMIARLIHSRMTTVIELKRHEVMIQHRWGPIHFELKGTPTQFLSVKRRLDFVRMSWVCEFVDWSGLGHTAAFNLTSPECVQLAIYLYEHLKEIDTGLAQVFAEQTLERPYSAIQNSLFELYFTPDELFASWGSYLASLTSFKKKLSLLQSGSKSRLLLRTQYLKRFESQVKQQWLQIRMPRYKSYVWAALLLFGWLPLSSLLIFSLIKQMINLVQNLSLALGCLGLKGEQVYENCILTNSYDYNCILGKANASAPGLILSLPLVMLSLAGFIFLINKMRSAQIEHQLDFDGERLLIGSSEKGDNKRIIPLSDIFNLGIVSKGRIMIFTKGGKAYPLSQGLSRFENITLLADLIEHLKLSDNSAMTKFSQGLQLSFASLWGEGTVIHHKLFAHLKTSRRVEFQSGSGLSWLDIKSHQMTGALVLQFWLGTGLSFVGLTELLKYNLVQAQAIFHNFLDYLIFTLYSFRLIPLSLLESQRIAWIKLPDGRFEFYPGSLYPYETFLYNEDLIYPQGLVWGILLMLVGAWLLAYSIFYACTRTRLTLVNQKLIILHRCLGFKWKKTLLLEQLELYHRPQFLSFSHRLMVSQKGKREKMPAAYHLNLSDIQLIKLRIDKHLEHIYGSQEAEL